MNKEIEIIKNSTKTMYKVLDYKLSPAEKLEVIRQLYDNLGFLRTELDQKEYKKEFSVIEERVQKIVDKITSPESVNDFLSKIKAIMETSAI